MAEACDSCGKPVLDGQLRYTAARPGPWHASCNERRLAKLERDGHEIRSGLNRLMRDLRRGRGA